jgi:trehalose 6-phosphate synthase
MQRLIAVSNRTPSQGPVAGGLAVAHKAALADRDGFWFGWSGDIVPHPADKARFRQADGLTIADIDLTRADYNAYYAGFSNRILWPAFHLRLDLTSFDNSWYEGYRRVNAQFAAALRPHLRPDDIIWVHDYHLIPLATELRALGVNNRIGFYLHIPFPSPEAFHAIPHNEELRRDFASYDLIGFQAERDVQAFRDLAAQPSPPSLPGDSEYRADFSETTLDAFPIGADPDAFARLAVSPPAQKMRTRVSRTLGTSKLIIGVDRLDYSKGLPQRVEAYEKLLTDDAELRRKVHFLQIAPPSRDTIEEYKAITDTLDAVCGRVMGRFSEPDWQPLTYVKRAYGQATLAGLYRLARIGLVTPLRDGMNLVAHEYIASQDPEDPGVLVLSRFAGAAEIFPEALQVNPFDAEETARAMKIGLTMPLEERKERWSALMAAAHTHSVGNWSESYLDVLAGESQPAPHLGPPEDGGAMRQVAGDFRRIAAQLKRDHGTGLPPLGGTN